MSDVEVYTADRETRRAVAQIRQAPDHRRERLAQRRPQGRRDRLWGALEMSVGIARDLGLSPRSDYQLFPIINGLVFANAEAYRILLLRHGGDLVFTADTAKECTVVVTGTNGTTYPPFTVTADEAKAARWGAASGLQNQRLPWAPSSGPAPPGGRSSSTNPKFSPPSPPDCGATKIPAWKLLRSPHPPARSRRQPHPARRLWAPPPPTNCERLLTGSPPASAATSPPCGAPSSCPPSTCSTSTSSWSALDIILDVIADDRPPDDDYEP